MPRFESDTDARRLGDALAALRRERGLSQAEAGRNAGMTSQGWGLYEAGRRPGLFRPDVQRRLTLALGATPEALALAIGSAPEQAPGATPSGVASAARSFEGAAGPAAPTRRLQLSNDDLSPWAASGVVLEYQPGRWPRRDQGCIIQTVDGQTLVRVYDRADAESIIVRGGPGGLGTEERIARVTAQSVSAVTARLEG